jgi:hypothetical protein
MGWIEKGEGKVAEFVREGVEVWLEEGRIDRAAAESLEASLHTPEVALGVAHAGAHFAISIPLRFPLGATARFIYTLLLRLRAEVRWRCSPGSADWRTSSARPWLTNGSLW